MSNPADMVMNLLAAAGVGTPAAETGWGLFVSRAPLKPDTTVTLFNTGGAPANPKWLVDYPTVQARVRGAPNGYLAGRSKIQEVKDALLGIDAQDVGGDRLDAITGLGDIQDLAYDENERPLFVMNFRLIVEPASGTHREPL